ncbi:aminopeptidase P family protein [Rhodococcus sp. IEGM 1408]|uniref:M24 family metallopeptidase n=1 Tax=Rhodococcus sp. IEGM 1408 TaxID=3082220 RepID=UPI002955D7BF|nr:aminopeptidase P family protein [Rhodococcus sp. IEGM 1408]MDV8000315.1 aminopeptidase P family protein [Rhodococcus sp. IEGM 1408]
MTDRLETRRRAVAAALAGVGATALLVTDPRNIAYLTGFRGSGGAVLVEDDGEAVLCTDSRYELQVVEQAPDVGHVISREYVPGVLGRRRGPGDAPLAVEADHLTLAAGSALRRALEEDGANPPVVETTGLVEQVRRAKDPAELALIEKACRVVDQAWTHLLLQGLLAVGRSEREVAADLEHAMRMAGSDGVAFETIVASGPNGAHPHHEPGDRVLATGDLVVVDFGAMVSGYASDCTRTVALGVAADRLLDAYEVVRRAQVAGVAAVREGLACSDLDAVSRDIIADAGFGDYFGHSLGHGVGLDVHEAPAVSSRSTSTLSDGDVITIEPGIYLPGLGGIRIEDTVAVTGGGGRSLTTTSTALSVL